LHRLRNGDGQTGPIASRRENTRPGRGGPFAEIPSFHQPARGEKSTGEIKKGVGAFGSEVGQVGMVAAKKGEGADAKAEKSMNALPKSRVREERSL